jgi:hypothetical protein
MTAERMAGRRKHLSWQGPAAAQPQTRSQRCQLADNCQKFYPETPEPLNGGNINKTGGAGVGRYSKAGGRLNIAQAKKMVVSIIEPILHLPKPSGRYPTQLVNKKLKGATPKLNIRPGT